MPASDMFGFFSSEIAEKKTTKWKGMFRLKTLVDQVNSQVSYINRLSYFNRSKVTLKCSVC